MPYAFNYFSAHKGPLSSGSYHCDLRYFNVTVHVNTVLLKHELSWPIFT